MGEYDERLNEFNEEQLAHSSPVTNDALNTGRINLKAGRTYAVVAATDSKEQIGDFCLSFLINQPLQEFKVVQVASTSKSGQPISRPARQTVTSHYCDPVESLWKQ